jgi:cytidyltransferase-like protein
VKRVLTIGTFDLLHVGHLELFDQCRRLADGGPVVVGVNTDEFVAKFKANPIIPVQERYKLVRALKGIDLVLHNMSAGRRLIEQVRPDLVVVGDDWLPAERYFKQIDVTHEWMLARHCAVAFVPRTTGQSTSRIKQTVLQSAQ